MKPKKPAKPKKPKSKDIFWPRITTERKYRELIAGRITWEEL